MRRHVDLLPLAALIIMLAACETNTFRVAGIPTYGHIEDVPVADIQAAIVAYERSYPGVHGPAEVISHDEILIYQDRERRNYTAMVRAKGTWEVGRVVLVHPRY
jgi:hypothetical protein